MLSPLSVTARQDTDLSILCDQEPDLLDRVASRLEKLAEVPLKISQLRLYFEEELGREAAVSLTRQLIALGTVARRRPADPPEVVDALTRGLQARRWPDEKLKRWDGVQSYVVRLLLLENVRILVKAIDLSFDYDTLYHSARIITDIRPVFDEGEEKTDIVGAIVSQMMRLSFRNEDGHQSMTLLLDRHDIEDLRGQCDEALNKAALIEGRLAKADLKTLSVGEDLDELR